MLSNTDTFNGVIYCTTNLISGKKYIGQSTSTRKDFDSYKGSGTAFYKALKRYGRENFIKEILQDNVPIEFLDESEIYWIDYFGADKSDLFYNIAKGGSAPMKGRNHTFSAKAKISAAFKGRKLSQEQIAFISKLHKGKKISEAHKERLREAHLNLSDESRKRMSLAQIGKKQSVQTIEKRVSKLRGVNNWRSKKIVQLQAGVPIKTWDCVSDIIRNFNIDKNVIYHILKTKKEYRLDNFSFMYLENFKQI